MLFLCCALVCEAGPRSTQPSEFFVHVYSPESFTGGTPRKYTIHTFRARLTKNTFLVNAGIHYMLAVMRSGLAIHFLVTP